MTRRSPRTRQSILTSASGWLLAAPVQAESLRPGTGAPAVGAGEVLQVALGLFVVLLLLAVLAWLARRVLHLQPATQGHLRVLGGLSLGSRERLLLVEVGETQLLVGVAPGSVRTLHVLDRPLQPARAEPVAERSFAALLGRMGGRPREGGRRD